MNSGVMRLSMIAATVMLPVMTILSNAIAIFGGYLVAVFSIGVTTTTYVNGLKGNLLLIHGSGDDNVHFQNSEVLINALVAANKPFTMMEYPNRTHCVCQGKNTQLHLFELITRYLDQNLKSAPPRPAAPERAAAGGR